LRQVIKNDFLFLFMINSIDEWRVLEKVLGKGRLIIWRPDGLHTWKKRISLMILLLILKRMKIYCFGPLYNKASGLLNEFSSWK
jgi:hypothetical protein